MTGTHDVTMCADILHENFLELNYHRLALLLLKVFSQVPVRGRALLENAIYNLDSEFTIA